MKPSSRFLILALIAASLIKLYLAVTTVGSLDAPGFLDHLHKIRELGVGAYRVRGAFNNPFNHPPAMIHVFKLWGWLADSTRLPFQFWVRIPSIAADIGSFFLAAALLRRIWPHRNRFWTMLALALSPTSILVSGYHCNTDAVMIFFTLLSIYLIETDKSSWLAGTAFGLAVCIKIMPLCLAPALVLFIEGTRKRLQLCIAAALTFIICSLPYLAQDPKTILVTVFGYNSVYGHWGWTLLASITFPSPPSYLHRPYEVQGAHAVFAQILKFVMLSLIIAASIWFNHFRNRPSLFLQAGFIVAILLFMTPGFGSQYVLWLVPFVPVLGLRQSILYYSVSTAYLLMLYLCYALGACLHPLIVVVLSLNCWLVILMLGLSMRRSLQIQNAA